MASPYYVCKLISLCISRVWNCKSTTLSPSPLHPSPSNLQIVHWLQMNLNKGEPLSNFYHHQDQHHPSKLQTQEIIDPKRRFLALSGSLVFSGLWKWSLDASGERERERGEDVKWCIDFPLVFYLPSFPFKGKPWTMHMSTPFACSLTCVYPYVVIETLGRRCHQGKMSFCLQIFDSNLS